MALEAGKRPGARTLALLGAKVVLSLGLIAFFVKRISFAEIRDAVRHASPEGLALAALLMLVSNVLGSWQWGRLLRAVDIRIPFWKVCAYYHVGLFFNNFLPANIGGDIARVYDASRHAETKASAVSTVLMDRLVGTLALAGLALVTTLPALDRFHLTVVYLMLVAFFAASLLLVWAVFHPALLPTVERVLARFGLGGIKPALDDLAAHLRGFRGDKGLFIRLMGLALVVQVSRIGVHMLVARALGLHIDVAYFFLFVPLLAVIVSLPISLNGIGVREGAGVLLFGFVGVDAAHAFSLQTTTFLVAFAVSLLGGLVVLARIPGRRAEARQSRRSN
jgi:uncharacterized protein (TIRG00374 family)